jgi:hypothetical protein
MNDGGGGDDDALPSRGLDSLSPMKQTVYIQVVRVCQILVCICFWMYKQIRVGQEFSAHWKRLNTSFNANGCKVGSTMIDRLKLVKETPENLLQCRLVTYLKGTQECQH